MTSLDKAHKRTQIVTGILTVVIALWIGVSIQKQRLTLQKQQTEIAKQTQILQGQQTETAKQTKLLQEQQLATQKQLAVLQKQDICLRHLKRLTEAHSKLSDRIAKSGISRDPFQQIVELCGYKEILPLLAGNLQAAREIVAENIKKAPATPVGKDFDGFAAIGNPIAQYNFHRAGTTKPPFSEGFLVPPGTKLVTRWPVNLRENTTDTEKEQNPILRTLPSGACVETVEKSLEERGQSWAKVKVVEC